MNGDANIAAPSAMLSLPNRRAQGRNDDRNDTCRDTCVVAVALLAAATLGACSSGSTVNLGEEEPPPYRFGTPRPVTDLGPQASDNPTLTGDLLEIFFTSNRDVSTDIWTARRASATAPFGAVTLVSEASSPAFETSSAISSDGLTLWFGSDRPGGLGGVDIWMVQRPARTAAWSVPVNLTALNSPALDLPRPPGLHDRVMPLSSERDNATVYWTYFSTRATEADAFGAPTSISELSFKNESTVDAFLTDDGLTLFYSSSPPGGAGDLFVASRRTTSDPFTRSLPLDDLNTPTYAERDPWLSPDGQTFFFTSDRGGLLQIYEAPASRM
jgi:hypothetical protein